MIAILKPWLLASRPKTLVAAFVPIFLATILAKSEGAELSWGLSLYAFLTAVFVQMGTNLVNDALDFKKGADTEERIGPVRVTQSGLLSYGSVLAGGIICFALALVCGLPLMKVGGLPLMGLLLLSVLCGYLYTGGPFPLAYTGLGDLFVLIFFGFAATCAVYYLQTMTVSVSAIVVGAQVGLLATVLIAVNNMRDIEGDAKAAKRTCAVRFGLTCARIEVTLLVFLAFALNIFWMFKGRFWAAVLPFAAAPIAVFLLKGIWSEGPGAIYNRFLGLASLLLFFAGMLMAAGFMLS